LFESKKIKTPIKKTADYLENDYSGKNFDITSA